jgi:hypothetical protein
VRFVRAGSAEAQDSFVSGGMLYLPASYAGSACSTPAAFTIPQP